MRGAMNGARPSEAQFEDRRGWEARGSQVQNDPFALPEGLPIPEDDGAADHLEGMWVPRITLPSTARRGVDPAAISAEGRVVLYCYPLTSPPGVELPEGWDLIPGARGCTPEACSFRDHHEELRELGAEVFGLSTQTTDYQRELVARLHLPFEVLSDSRLEFARTLRLPTFELDEAVELQPRTLIKRLTLVLLEGRIEKVFYPIFPPNEHAEEVVAWLSANPVRSRSMP